MPKKVKLPELVIAKGPIAAFRRKALRTDNEVLAACVGTVSRQGNHVTKVVIEDLAYPMQATATPDQCAWDLLRLAELQIAVQPKQIVGSLHSHPNEEVIHRSAEDVESAFTLGEVIYGIFTWAKVKGGKRRRTDLSWYWGQTKL